MGESLLTSLSFENSHHLYTLLSMDPTGAISDECDRELLIQRSQITLSCVPPDINLPLSSESSPLPPQLWNSDPCDLLDVGLGGPQIYEAESAMLNLPKVGAGVTHKRTKRGDSIWGTWFFFTFYFKPMLSERPKGKVSRDGNGVMGFDKSDLRLDGFLVQHDIENMYMWVFKERPENAFGKMQLRSYMNGHSRLGEPLFPFSVDKGFVRSHRMQRKQYRGLSNPQCIHGIEIVRLPDLTMVAEGDQKKWLALTGRGMNFSIPIEASDFGSWRSMSNTEFELERPLTLPTLKTQRKLLNGSVLNLSTQSPSQNGGSDAMDLLPKCGSKRRNDFFLHGMDEDCCLPVSSVSEQSRDMEINPIERSWLHDFNGVMRHSYGPATAAKTIYEDKEGYLIMVTLPFSDRPRVKVSWRNSLTRGVVKLYCVSTARMPCVKRHDRTFKLTDPSPEQCPPGEFIREIPLPTRIPEDAKLEAYYDETGTVLEIMVPKYRVGPEEHEVHVCLRPPHLGASELLLT